MTATLRSLIATCGSLLILQLCEGYTVNSFLTHKLPHIHHTHTYGMSATRRVPPIHSVKKYWDFESGGAYVTLNSLRTSLATTEDRSSWMKLMVAYPENTPWEHVKTVLVSALSLKQEWTFGLYDTLYDEILQGKYDATPEAETALIDELDRILEMVVAEYDIIAMNLLMQSAIEIAEEEREYEAEVTIKSTKPPDVNLSRGILDKSRYLKETYEKKVQTMEELPLLVVSAEADKRRRAAAFRALCLLRFVRTGI